jgi:hypothetical protein
MNALITALLISLVPVLLVGGFVVLLLRSRGQALPRSFWVVLLAVFVVSVGSYLLAANGFVVADNVSVAVEGAFGLVFAFYAYRSWQKSGWSPATRRPALLVLAAIAAILLTVVSR